MTAANTFALYLSKSDVLEFDDLLTEAARHRLNGRSARKATSDAIGDGAALYTFAGRRKIPPWAEQLKAHFTLDQDLWTESPCAILVFRKDERLFAITFSYAHVYLDDRRTETDFGLRVAINFVNDDRLRSVERSNIGNAIRDLAQSPDQKDLRSFGFNDVLDLIRKVTGSGSENSFADRVTGAHSLRFSKAIAIDDIPDTAALAVKLFQAAFYKETAFRIIDSLSPISDLSLESSLNEALLEAIRDGSDEFAISLPEILPDHVVSFRFERMHANKFHPDLSLELYRDNLGDRLTTLALEELKHHRVAAYDVNEDSHTPAGRCIMPSSAQLYWDMSAMPSTREFGTGLATH